MGLAVKGKAPLPAVAGVGRRMPACGGIRRRPEPTAGHADQVVGLIWSTDSTLLASNGLDGTVLIWKLP